MKIWRVVLSMSILLWSVSAWAQTEPKVKVIDIEDDLSVVGTMVKPNELNEGVTLHKKRSSLIKLRQDFVKEVQATADEI